jgi:hypothetical protein
MDDEEEEEEDDDVSASTDDGEDVSRAPAVVVVVLVFSFSNILRPTGGAAGALCPRCIALSSLRKHTVGRA